MPDIDIASSCSSLLTPAKEHLGYPSYGEHIGSNSFDLCDLEWDVLEQIAAGSLDELSVGQIVAEVHFGDSEMRGGGWEMEQRELDILKNMQGAGWAMWRREDNEQGYEQYRSFLRGQGSCCFDVGWMRKTFSH